MPVIGSSAPSEQQADRNEYCEGIQEGDFQQADRNGRDRGHEDAERRAQISAAEAKAGGEVEPDGGGPHPGQDPGDPHPGGAAAGRRVKCSGRYDQRDRHHHQSGNGDDRADSAPRNWLPIKTARFTLVAPGTICDRA